MSPHEPLQRIWEQWEAAAARAVALAEILRGQAGSVALVDGVWPETGLVTACSRTSVFAGFRFLGEVISLAVRWYLRYGLSYRDVEELLAERGVTVDHVTI